MYCAEILVEYREVLARPRFGLDPSEVRELSDLLAEIGEEVGPGDLAKSPLAVWRPPTAHFPDPDDALFVAVGLVGDVDAIVTGITWHFAEVVRSRVYAPTEFREALELLLSG